MWSCYHWTWTPARPLSPHRKFQKCYRVIISLVCKGTQFNIQTVPFVFPVPYLLLQVSLLPWIDFANRYGNKYLFHMQLVTS